MGRVETELRNIKSGNTVQYGWLRRQKSAEALIGIVGPYKQDDETIKLNVWRGLRLGIVELESDWVVLDLGLRGEKLDLSRRPLVPGVKP